MLWLYVATFQIRASMHALSWLFIVHIAIAIAVYIAIAIAIYIYIYIEL